MSELIKNILRLMGYPIIIEELVYDVGYMNLLYLDTLDRDYNKFGKFLGLINEEEIISIKKGENLIDIIMESVLVTKDLKRNRDTRSLNVSLETIFKEKEKKIKQSIIDADTDIKVLNISISWKPVRAITVLYTSNKIVQDVIVIRPNHDINIVGRQDINYIIKLNKIRSELFDMQGFIK